MMLQDPPLKPLRRPTGARTPLVPHSAQPRRRRQEARCQAASLSGPGLPAGSTGLPLVGETFEFLGNYIKFYQDRFAKHGPIFKSHILGQALVVVNDATEARRLLQAEHRLVQSFWPESMRRLLGPHSLLVAPKARHRRLRGALQQAFTEQAIRSYGPTVAEVVEGTLARWAADPAAPVYTFRAMRALAFDVAAAVLLGTRFDGPRTERLRDTFDVYAEGLFALPLNLPGTKFGRATRARESLLQEIGEIIVKGKETMAANAAAKERGIGARPNALHLLLQARDEDGNALSLDELKDQVLTQLFAGHETSGSMLWSILVELQKNPRVLQRLREEQAEVVREHGPNSLGALTAMPYAEAVLKEGLRRHNIVDAVWRRALEDLTIGGYHVPQGTTVQLMIARPGLAEPQWEDSKYEFQPERWLQEGDRKAASKKDPHSYFPWGDGPRKCLGMLLARAEILVFLAALARGYGFEVLDPNEPLGINMKPINNQPALFYRYDPKEETASAAPAG